MKKLIKIDNKLDDSKIDIFINPNTVEICSFVCENEKPFEILVSKNDLVKINQPILKNEDGQIILSSISGKIIDISLKNNYKNELTYIVTIENDFKEETLTLNKTSVNTKKDLNELVKKFGVINNNFLIYKFFENINENLYINSFDEVFVYNNFCVLENYFNEISDIINKLKTLLNVKKTIFYTSKINIAKVKKIATKKDKIITKSPIVEALSLVDLLNIFNALNNKPQVEKLISVTGKALNKNKVVLLKNGTKINDIIEHFGGIKQSLEEIENFKYTAMLAYNDELILRQKIKKCKVKTDREKLINMLKNKQNEAFENVYSKREEFYKKYLNCLSVSLLSDGKQKIIIDNYNYSILNTTDGIHLLNNKQFKK